jgi:plasmid stabilization system protein ParE
MRPSQVRLTVGAERDLTGIYRRRLAQRGAEGVDGAEALLLRLIAGIEGLALHPEKGPVPTELEAVGIREYRQLSLPPYRIICWLEDAMVTVMLIADARRDFRTLLQERVLGGR